jgi:mannose-6-phosphate isomerase
VKPVRLGPNQLHRFYRGGAAIARLRGTESVDDFAPEDWVGSSSTTFRDTGAGLSALPDGTLLRDALAADPEGFLGPEHVARYGPDPALLVKLLDAGERLPVHSHPDDEFARRRLGVPYGKTEAWLIVEARGQHPSVHLGFREDVERDALAEWVERQDSSSMLAALNELPVAAGDCIFVPAGVPHSIGVGVFLVELQEPSDLSVLLEWAGFAFDGAREGHLGLGFDVALDSVVREALQGEELSRLKRSTEEAPEVRPGARSLLPAESASFFRAERLRPNPVVTLEPSFSILVVLDGAGDLGTEQGGTMGLVRGDTVLVPYAAGAGELTGAGEVIRCLPPAADRLP